MHRVRAPDQMTICELVGHAYGPPQIWFARGPLTWELVGLLYRGPVPHRGRRDAPVLEHKVPCTDGNKPCRRRIAPGRVEGIAEVTT